MSPAFNSGDPASTPRSDATHAEARPDGSSPDAGVLGQVLDQTLNAAAGLHLEPGDWAAMRQAVKGLVGQPFGLEPVAVEMVYAALRAQFEPQGVPLATIRAMAVRIATTLYEDPVSRGRLETVWKQLSEPPR